MPFGKAVRAVMADGFPFERERNAGRAMSAFSPLISDGLPIL